jgi:hypothetical protein
VQELSERSAAELVQRQERRQLRQRPRRAPAYVAPSDVAPDSGGKSDAAVRSQTVHRTPAIFETQQLAAVSAQSRAPSLSSSSDGGGAAGDVPPSLWQRVAGDAPPPYEQLRRHRQRNADDKFLELEKVMPVALHPVALQADGSTTSFHSTNIQTGESVS